MDVKYLRIYSVSRKSAYNQKREKGMNGYSYNPKRLLPNYRKYIFYLKLSLYGGGEI